MVFHLYCICYTFVLDKYDDIFVSTLASFVSRQMLYQICVTFVFEPNTVKCMISSSVRSERGYFPSVLKDLTKNGFKKSYTMRSLTFWRKKTNIYNLN